MVDQFEQVFTACPDEAERQAFITAVGALASPRLVVLGLRADFYGRALRYAGLAAALQERQLAVGPMPADQLRRAISGRPGGPGSRHRGPGRAAAAGPDAALRRARRPGGGRAAAAVPRAARDLGARPGRPAHRGRLPGQRRDHRRDRPDRRGCLRRAAADEQQRLARWLFLRLVQVADESIETRCQVPLAELGELAGDGPDGGGTGVLSPVHRRAADHRHGGGRADHPRRAAAGLAPAAGVDRSRPGRAAHSPPGQPTRPGPGPTPGTTAQRCCAAGSWPSPGTGPRCSTTATA